MGAQPRIKALMEPGANIRWERARHPISTGYDGKRTTYDIEVAHGVVERATAKYVFCRAADTGEIEKVRKDHIWGVAPGTSYLSRTNWQPDGWHVNGKSWRCPSCGTIIGSNLLGEKPFWAKSQHKCLAPETD